MTRKCLATTSPKAARLQCHHCKSSFYLLCTGVLYVDDQLPENEFKEGGEETSKRDIEETMNKEKATPTRKTSKGRGGGGGQSKKKEEEEKEEPTEPAQQERRERLLSQDIEQSAFSNNIEPYQLSTSIKAWISKKANT